MEMETIHGLESTKDSENETAVSSSFPSRAVTCATVYSFLVSYAYIYDVENGILWITWWMPILIIVSVLLASFARINMGVHYPSDCIIGLFQGILVCVIGTMLWHADVVGCDSCFVSKCYSSNGSLNVITRANWERITFVTMGVGVVVSFIIAIVSVVKPFDFWGKCDRVYGMLLPGMLFQITFLCRKASGTTLFVPPPTPWYGYFYGIAFTAIASVSDRKMEH